MIAFAPKKLRISIGRRQSEVSTLTASWQSFALGETGLQEAALAVTLFQNTCLS